MINLHLRQGTFMAATTSASLAYANDVVGEQNRANRATRFLLFTSLMADIAVVVLSTIEPLVGALRPPSIGKLDRFFQSLVLLVLLLLALGAGTLLGGLATFDWVQGACELGASIVLVFCLLCLGLCISAFRISYIESN
jgi:hypothetical protein